VCKAPSMMKIGGSAILYEGRSAPEPGSLPGHRRRGRTSSPLSNRLLRDWRLSLCHPPAAFPFNQLPLSKPPALSGDKFFPRPVFPHGRCPILLPFQDFGELSVAASNLHWRPHGLVTLDEEADHRVALFEHGGRRQRPTLGALIHDLGIYVHPRTQAVPFVGQ